MPSILFLKSLSCFILLASIVSFLHAQESKDATTVLSRFTELKGKVADSQGNSVDRFSVRVIIYDHSETGNQLGVKPKSLGEWKTNSSNGEFQFDVDQPMELTSKTWLSCRVTAEGFLPLEKELYGRSEVARFKGDFKKIRLKRAIKVTGRITMPASAADEKLLNPQIRFSRSTSNMSLQFHESGGIAKDGSFTALVPDDCELNVAANSYNAAAAMKTIKIEKWDSGNGVQDLGIVQLKEGVSISGVVLSIDGKPVEGQVVNIAQRIHSLVVNEIVVTDAEGKFKLPPREGKAVIKLIDRAYVDGKVIKVNGEVLIANPIVLTLRPGKLMEEIQIREAETCSIHGSVAFEDGSVPRNVYMAADDAMTSMQYRIDVDSAGRFKFKAAKDSAINLMIMYNEENILFFSSLKKESLVRNRDFLKGYKNESQHFQFKPLKENVGPLDFVLLEHIPDETTVTELLFDWVSGN